MRYLIRPMASWDENGYVEWTPGRNKWYPLSQVSIRPSDIREKFIFKILPKLWEQGRKPLLIEKVLVINKIYSCQEIDDNVKSILEQTQIEDDEILYSEDMYIELDI
jgi:hypothetical protein